ncbi:MAG: hypothetical protein K0B81_07955 [Candidatus Cloacimonetes bacterium]|nr:hypothetical protein [Candidatus Cloacimonadota bacterium]
MKMGNNKILRLTWLFLSLTALLPLLLVSCSGKETFAVDTTPPLPVILIPHLGDTGDNILVGGVLVNDTNNGIDTVPDNDWIRLQWQTVIDPDLSYLKIFRYGDYAPTPVDIDSLSRAQVNLNEYLDNRLHQQSNVIGQTWYYYIQGYDLAGNYSVSDTVSYKLLEKPLLLSPGPNATVSLTEPIDFQWWRTGDSIEFRLLVFVNDDQYFWHSDFFVDSDVEDDILTLTYSGPSLDNFANIVWRVDSFADIDHELHPEGIAMSGAESNERVLYLTP